MNPDDFEQQLQRRPIRPIPAEWRREILAAAFAAASIENQKSKIKNSWWSALLWPSPKAWAGLAAIWLMILGANFSTGNKSQKMAQIPPPPTAEAMVAWRQQQRELARLMESYIDTPPEPVKPYIPGPKGEIPSRSAMV